VIIVRMVVMEAGCSKGAKYSELGERGLAQVLHAGPGDFDTIAKKG